MNMARFVVLSTRTHTRRRGTQAAAVIVAAALAAAQTPALAGATITGDPEAVTLDAQDSSIGEILAGLARDFNVHYRSSTDLNRHITGTYQGSLRQVVARVLGGYNFIVASSRGGMEVTIFGAQNAGAAPAWTGASAPPAAVMMPSAER
jgi:hypothetical protein